MLVSLKDPIIVMRLTFRTLALLLLLVPLLLIAEPVAAASCLGRTVTISGAGVINGTSGNDVILGSNRNDTIHGNGGVDKICGLAGKDLLSLDTGRGSIDGGDDEQVCPRSRRTGWARAKARRKG